MDFLNSALSNLTGSTSQRNDRFTDTYVWGSPQRITVSQKDLIVKKDKTKFFRDGEVKRCTKIDPVTLYELTNPQQGLNVGFLYVTNFRVFFQGRVYSNGTNPLTISIPLMTIHSAKREYISTTTSKITIKTKDLRYLYLMFEGKETLEQSNFVHKFIIREVKEKIESIDNLFAFQYRVDRRKQRFSSGHILTFDEWRCYDPSKEYERLGLCNYWSVGSFNSEYNLCDTYPQYICVPTGVSYSELAKVAQFRSRGRIPAVTWKHPQSNATLSRCSQPLVGLYGQTCAEDKKLIQLLRSTNTEGNELYILDARPKANAIGNQVSGAGWERDYEGCVVHFMNIDNIHEVRSSFNRLFSLIRNNTGEESWYAGIDSTGWLRHIQTIIRASNMMVDILENKKSSILVHCSDGWDRTSQILSLCELMMDPYYRTIEGFIVLIEKEWHSFGHHFSERLFGYQEHGKINSSKISPIWLQFVDCVWQCKQQFPISFEFNAKFLLLLIDALHECKYGTFLYNSEKERRMNTLHIRTDSLWMYVLENKDAYTDPLYRLNENILLVSHHPRRLQVWNEFYLRWDQSLQQRETIEDYVKHLVYENEELQRDIKRLRASQTRAVKTQNMSYLRSESIDIRKTLKQSHVKDIVNEIVNAALERVTEKQMNDFRNDNYTTPRWKEDSSTKWCSNCGVTFTFFRRKHHCRSCGEIFCDICTTKRRAIPQFNILTLVRVCDLCYDKLDRQPELPHSPRKDGIIMDPFVISRQRSRSVG